MTAGSIMSCPERGHLNSGGGRVGKRLCGLEGSSFNYFKQDSLHGTISAFQCIIISFHNTLCQYLQFPLELFYCSFCIQNRPFYVVVLAIFSTPPQNMKIQIGNWDLRKKKNGNCSWNSRINKKKKLWSSSRLRTNWRSGGRVWGMQNYRLMNVFNFTLEIKPVYYF